MNEETSEFIKRYKQILIFKSQATKKKNNIRKNSIKTDNSTVIKKKIPLILPNININRKISTSQMSPKDNIIKKDKDETQSLRKPEKSKRNILDIQKLIDKFKNNSKEYKQFIIEQSDISPKKNIKEINDTFYKRLLKKENKNDLLNNSADDTKINYSNEDNNNKIIIKLPFLKNIKSRYFDYNERNKNMLLNKINQSFSGDESPPKIKKSKSNLKDIKLDKSLKKRNRNYFYLILPGNNSQLVEKCLITRPNWKKISDTTNLSSCNFIWTEVSQEMNFTVHKENCRSQIINHFEYHNEVSNKGNLFINLLRYCEYNGINLFSFYPLTIVLNFNDESYKEKIEAFKRLYSEIPSLIEDESKDIEKQKNYCDYFKVISVKKSSCQKIVIPKSNYIGKNLWLIKRTNLNRGREIKVISDLTVLLNEIEISKKENKNNFLIIQKYIEDPLLYNMRKFDIRIWVLFLFLSTKNKFEVYVFKEGHLKACSETFNLDSSDLFVHLTNYSVQKYNKNFSKTEIGNEISFQTFQKELDKNGIKKNFKKEVFPKIIKIIAYSANASKNKINILSKNNIFEIFGYDLILDKNFEPFLLEINTNPGLEESSPLIQMLVPRMIDDAFRLTIDEVFERNDENKNISKFKVDGYTDEENMWQFVNLKI